jgi:hypothetical protein
MKKPANDRGLCYDNHVMSTTPPRTVKETGARADDLLVGIRPRNMGLVVRIFNDQEPGEGGRVAGAIEVVHWGQGKYADAVFQACSERSAFGSVDEFIRRVTSVPNAADFTHGLNANGLWRLDAESIADKIINSAAAQDA